MEHTNSIRNISNNIVVNENTNINNLDPITTPKKHHIDNTNNLNMINQHIKPFNIFNKSSSCLDSFNGEDCNDNIIMCSFYLPFSASLENGKWILKVTNEPLYHTLYHITKGYRNVKLVGILKNINKINDESIIKELYTSLLNDYHMYPLNINKEMYDTLMKLFDTILEPQFHYISIEYSFHYQIEKYWDTYRNFNEIVCRQIIDLLSIDNENLILLHDYYFFFVPSLLYSYHLNFSKNKSDNIISVGLFLHSPFPDQELFRRLTFREEIMKSMMNCSVIGFHTFSSSQNFITCCKELLQVECESTLQGDFAISYFGRKVVIYVNNITPEQELIKHEVENNAQFKSIYNSLKKKYNTKYVFVSMDHVQFLFSTFQKIEGYKRFLEELPKEYVSQSVLLIFIKLSYNNFKNENEIIYTKEQVELLKKIEMKVKEIQTQFGPDVIESTIKQISYTERLAYSAIGNCFLRTPKRESFSLGIFEFLLLKLILCDNPDNYKGYDVEYILTELSGVNSFLANAIRINPFDPLSIKKGFASAFESFTETFNRVNKEKDFALVRKSSAKEWFWSFCKEIKKFKPTNTKNENVYFSSGIGLGFKLMKNTSEFNSFINNIDTVMKKYTVASKRLFFVNYDFSIENEKNEKMKNLLEILSQDKKNIIYYLSDKTKNEINSFKLFINSNITIVSHGDLSYKSIKTNNIWILDNTNQIHNMNQWAVVLKNFLKPYRDNCEGSEIIINDYNVIWDYSDGDIELGKHYSKLIESELKVLLKHSNLKCTKGNNCLEIYNKKNNKGNYVSHVLKDIISKHTLCPEFILAIGFNNKDEVMFNYLNSKEYEIKTYMKQPEKGSVYTVVIGKMPSVAKYYFDGVGEVVSLFEEFCRSSAKQRNAKSSFSIKEYWDEKEEDSEEEDDVNLGEILVKSGDIYFSKNEREEHNES